MREGVHMKEKIRIENWRLAWLENAEVKAKNIDLRTPSDVLMGGYPTIEASVPGNFELDFMREGIIEDIYFGENSVKMQKLENLHLYYFTKFTYAKKEGFDSALVFEGVDTVAEIFIDGEKVGFVENMFHAHSFSLQNLTEGEHTLLVHIIPAAIYARQFELPAMCFGLKYNHDATEMRKSASMFGWDIMPRIVSGGLWKPVNIVYVPKSRIVNPFTYTSGFGRDYECAFLKNTFRIETEADYITDFTVEITGQCGDSVFHETHKPYTANVRLDLVVANPKIWWPKNYGEPNLYDIEIKLFYKGVLCDSVQYKTGIRTVWLRRTSCAGENGEFCFVINCREVFVMGTNWVPTDAFPSRHNDYTLRALEMVNDQGCNMIRCWGGNAYPDDILYDYCDEHGIMVWQDFALGCGHYPDDERICRLVKEEVKNVVIERRNHPSLVLWAGDNECDCFVVPYWEAGRTDKDPKAMLDPNLNKLTRDIILREVRNHDATRPYLPSSPYVDEMGYLYGNVSESHLWGPRDYFKGDYYRDPECHFASEIGYHGCPSPKSLEKFISADSLPKADIHEICDNGEWLTHAAGMETQVKGNPYAYRLPLMISQVERIFGKASGDLATFAKQSQISQAEAVKYFIENFRNNKWRKTGILWWNIIDGWPQISDAVVDWYGCKKLAYYYIKRSQQTVGMGFKEPVNGQMELMAYNDSREGQTLSYTVENLSTGEVVAQGEVFVHADAIARAAVIPEEKYAFYLIKWAGKGVEGVNHHACSLGDVWEYEKYEECLKKAGFYDEFEGF